MGIGRLYKAQKNKRNVTKGAKELLTVDKLSKKTITEIDSLLSNIDNDKMKKDLLSLKAMISTDLSSGDTIGISNYMYGRLYRTHVTSEYGISKKKHQIKILEEQTLIPDNKELATIFESSKEILSLNIKIARNLLGLTQDYAIANRDLLPRNQKEFDLYFEEYDTYINERVTDITSKFETVNFDNIDNTILADAKDFLNENLPLTFLSESLDNIDEYTNKLFIYDLRITKLILILKALEITDNEDLNSFIEVLINFNKLVIMAALNIFKTTKPFNEKYKTLLGEVNLEEKIKSDFEIISDVYTKLK
ncbi:MAG: hypothetical protein ACRCWG_11160 [Sarcina sp.]